MLTLVALMLAMLAMSAAPAFAGEGPRSFGCSPPWAPNFIYAASPQEAVEYRKMGYTCRPAPRPEEL
jgi:hypothetical protein